MVGYFVTKYILKADYPTSRSEFDISGLNWTLFEITVKVKLTFLI